MYFFNLFFEFWFNVFDFLVLLFIWIKIDLFVDINLLFWYSDCKKVIELLLIFVIFVFIFSLFG